jgi:hypothetical protein
MNDVPKHKRIKDEKLLRSFRGKPCAVCQSTEGTVAHHLKTKGSGGDDEESNLIALCQYHHRQIHDIGSQRFRLKYKF